MKKFNKKKGFTLVEGVIALAVITIISAAVTSLCIYSTRASSKIFAQFQASNIAADVVTCFKSACKEDSNQKTTFEKYLGFYVGDDLTAGSNITDYSYYEFTIDSVRAEVSAYFTSGAEKVVIYTYHSSLESSLYSYGYSLSDGEIEV